MIGWQLVYHLALPTNVGVLLSPKKEDERINTILVESLAGDVGCVPWAYLHGRGISASNGLFMQLSKIWRLEIGS